MFPNTKLLPLLMLAGTAAAQNWRGQECTPSFWLGQEKYVQAGGLGLKTDNNNLRSLLGSNLYLYVNDIPGNWPKKPLRLTVFFDDSSHWKSPGIEMKEQDFEARAKKWNLKRWSAPIAQKGESIQFRFDGTEGPTTGKCPSLCFRAPTALSTGMRGPLARSIVCFLNMPAHPSADRLASSAR